jgi:hypothetical protein
MIRACLMLSCLVLCSCTQFPELDAVQTPGIERAPYPELLPFDALAARPATRIAAGEAPAVLGRADALRARGTRLRAVDPGPSGVDARRARLQARAAELRQR